MVCQLEKVPLMLTSFPPPSHRNTVGVFVSLVLCGIGVPSDTKHICYQIFLSIIKKEIEDLPVLALGLVCSYVPAGFVK